MLVNQQVFFHQWQADFQQTGDLARSKVLPMQANDLYEGFDITLDRSSAVMGVHRNLVVGFSLQEDSDSIFSCVVFIESAYRSTESVRT